MCFSTSTARMLRILACVFTLVTLGAGCGGSGTTDDAGSVPASENSQPDGAAAAPPNVEMAKVPAGLFLYGATEDQFQLYLGQTQVGFPGVKERLRNSLVIPAQPVNLPDFWMDEFEVTNRQFAAFLKSSGYQPSSRVNYLKEWQGSTYPDWAGDFPVVWVSAEDAEAYCHWRGGRLPTDQEWEKAFRGPSGALFPWGNNLPGRETTNVGTGKMEPVGNRPGDLSPFGIYDLAGNVCELVGNPVEHDCVMRGSSFQGGLRSVIGFHRSPGLSAQDRAGNLGFRCASDRPPEEATTPTETAPGQ